MNIFYEILKHVIRLISTLVNQDCSNLRFEGVRFFHITLPQDHPTNPIVPPTSSSYKIL